MDHKESYKELFFLRQFASIVTMLTTGMEEAMKY